MTNFNSIPPELKVLRQWVFWKADKKPRNPHNNQLASVSDPRTWDTFDNACKAVKNYAGKGVGFVFTGNDAHCGVDLDKVISEDGQLDPEAQDIINRLDSYTEVSQSGRGIHIIVRAKKPGNGSKSEKLEIYDSGRFFALTGDLWEERGAINDRQSELDSLYERLFGTEKPKSEPITTPIYEGDGRNIACTREAGRLLNIYKDPAVVKSMIWVYNRTVCVPPLDKTECAKTWEKSLAKWAEKAEPEQKAAPEPPQVVSAIELAEKEFPDLKFAIPDILPEGLTLLAGKPKCGKSWLVLLMAYSVALGRNLMNGSQIERGNALVLALEDGERRLKDRVSKIDAADCVLKEVTPLVSGGVHIVVDLGEGVPGGLDLATTWPKIGSGGIEELERYLDEHPDTRLIVIDVVKRFTKKKGKGTSYDEDYDSIQPIQELAKRRGVAILGVVHSRKAKSDDPFEMVSGTFGLTGSADSIMVLQREIEEDYRLSITGRDIEPRELALKFKNCVWRVLGDATDYFISEKQLAILELLEHEILGPKEVAERLGMKESTAKSTLWRMAKAGMLVHKNGKYWTAGR